ncbi:MAG: bifunctional folylpolyglutamate synthase/dihydrofolate synthase [Lewinellaceae bacterium]|nr:bifunctional folylpolyglutamate synthase/dihydrofolate synthase [Lewinellaceae bacterium]
MKENSGMKYVQNYSDALKYVYAQLPMFQRQGAAAYKKDLHNTLALCKILGHPEKKLKTVHIAGTNGKGTVTHLIAGGLQAQGYKVGVYTSPHYKDLRERIKINGEYIDKKYIVDVINLYYNEIEKIKPSFFELMVVLAFQWFVDNEVDYAVIETGLGGRLDSTNVITPLLSVITNISFDHQNMLGNTLEEIAGEKAGIIKSNVPVVIGEYQKEVHHVFEQKSKEVAAPIYIASNTSKWLSKNASLRHMTGDFILNGKKILTNLDVDIAGPFQEKNLVTALFSLHMLSQYVPLDFQKLKSFYINVKQMTSYFGRWEILGESPMILADSAHNLAGISQVLSVISGLRYSKFRVVIGLVNDKDASGVLGLLPKDAQYYFAKANIPRGKEANALREEALQFRLYGKAYSSVRKALAAAKVSANKDDVILILGSIFVVAEVL